MLILEHFDGSPEGVLKDVHLLDDDILFGLVCLARQVFVDLVQDGHRLR